MSKSVVVTARISEEILALLDRIAESKDRSRAWVIARAIEKQAKAETEFMDFVQAGVNDIEAGRFVTHEELVANLRARRDARRAA